MVHNFKMQPKGKSTKALQRTGEEDVSPGAGVEYSDTSIYTIGSGHFQGFRTILNFKIWWGFRKMKKWGGGGGV